MSTDHPAFDVAVGRLRDAAASGDGTLDVSTFRPPNEQPYLYATLSREVAFSDVEAWASVYAILAFETLGYLVMNVYASGGGEIRLAVSGPLEKTASPKPLTDPHSGGEKAALADAGRAHLIRP